jgi:hypothetical protein
MKKNCKLIFVFHQLGNDTNDEIGKIVQSLESIKFKGQFTSIDDNIDPAKLLPSTA